MRSSQPPFVTRVVQRVTDARWRVLLVAAVVVVAIGSGARLLTMNADYKVFFSRENPQLAAFTNFQVTRADGDDLYVEDLVESAAGLSDAELAAVRATALAEPQLVNRLVSPRGDITALNITLKLPGE